MDNPLLIGDGLPPFDRIAPEHVVPAVEKVCHDLVAGLEHLEANAPPTWEGLIEPLNDVEEPLSRTWGTVEHLIRVKNSEALRAAHREAQPKIVEAGLRLSQSRPLFEKLEALKASSAFSELDAGQRRAVEHRLRAARLAGVALQGEAKERFQALTVELEECSTRFADHVLDATKAWGLTITDKAALEGTPITLRETLAAAARADGHEQATADDGPWRVTLDYAALQPFLAHCPRRELREEVYRAHITRASTGEIDNQPLIEKLLQLRREKATLLDLGSFAELSLASKMADSVEQVRSLLDELWEKSIAPARDEHQELVDLARERPELGVDPDDLKHWDVGFLAERLREARFDLRDEDTRPYLPLEHVLDGLFALAGQLFGVQVQDATDQVPRWHDDVRFFQLKDKSTGRSLAGFYLDPYSRPADKRGGAWMDECRARRRTDAGVQPPVAYLCCNQTPPSGDRPSLMSFREVETLFHEFGHGLQHMLTAVEHLDVSGINGVEWDAVELPSQFMENWCYQKDVLVGLSHHYQTGDKLPDELFDKIQAARTFRSASAMLRQIYFARVDLALHTEHQPGSEPAEAVKKRVAEATLVMPPLDEDRFLCGFTHIFAGGYAAGYYSYKWAEVLAADAFGAFEDAGLDDDQAREQTGRRFRETILGEGGSRHPMEVFEAFRGRAPTPDALLRLSGLAA